MRQRIAAEGLDGMGSVVENERQDSARGHLELNMKLTHEVSRQDIVLRARCKVKAQICVKQG